MAIVLNDDTSGAGSPVVKRQAIGQRFIGALVRPEQRDVLKDDKPVLKDNGKPRQELVVHCIALPGTTTEVGIKDDVHLPAPGEECRMILRGKTFGDWITAKDHLGTLQVGDIIEQTLDTAQAYDANGGLKGGPITSQDEVTAHRMRGATIGVYGPLTIRRATAAEAQWVAAAEAAYMAQTAVKLDTPATAPAYDEAPF